jgi:hypothetical protein
VTWEHQRVQELLAAHVLGGLQGEDAALAERALVEHVPRCEQCRRAHDELRAVAGDLALAATPARPPDLLWARLRRTVAPSERRRLAPVAAAGVLAGVVALAGWNVVLGHRLGRTEEQQAMLADAVTSVGHPSSTAVPLSGRGDQRVMLLHVPGEDVMYLVGTRLPDSSGVYRVWLVGGGRTWSPGTLHPERGVALLRVQTDPSGWDTVMVTEEPSDEAPSPVVSPMVSARVGG